MEPYLHSIYLKIFFAIANIAMATGYALVPLSLRYISRFFNPIINRSFLLLSNLFLPFMGCAAVDRAMIVFHDIFYPIPTIRMFMDAICGIVAIFTIGRLLVAASQLKK